MSPNDTDGMANSVDPDQTAPLGAVWSGSALFAQAYLSENLGSLQYNGKLGIGEYSYRTHCHECIIKPGHDKTYNSHEHSAKAHNSLHIELLAESDQCLLWAYISLL